MPCEETVFLNKLGEIPLINDGWSTATEYYSRIKDYNSVMRLTLSMAESSVKVAGTVSTPVFNLYQPQINNINGYACKKLDELENRYPSIKQPTEEWKKTCTGLVEPVVGQVKPLVSHVHDIVNNGKQKIVNIKTAGTNMVEEAKNLGVGTAAHVFNSTFETTPGRFITRTVDSALNVADGLVDKYLVEEEIEPIDDNDTSDDELSSSDESTEKNMEQMQEMDPTPRRVMLHAGSISEKIRRRMFKRAMKDFTYAKARASSALNHMQSTVNLVDFAKNNITTVKGKADDLWIEITKDLDPSEQEKTTNAGTLEDRVIALGRLVTRHVRSNVTAFEKVFSEVGEFGRHPISKSKEYKQLIETFVSIESIQTFSSEKLAQANASLKSIQSMIQTMVNSVKDMNWMVLDIDMNEIPLSDSDLGLEQVISSNNNSEDEVEREENH